MTHVAVFSDTHGMLHRLPEAIKRAGEIDAFLHLGDFGSDAKRMADVLRTPYCAVRGNCDAYNSDYPRSRVVHFEEVSLFLTHGDGFFSPYALTAAARENGCAAALFGHTHEPLVRADGETLLINPGSLSKPRYGFDPSFALLEIEGRTVRVKMITL